MNIFINFEAAFTTTNGEKFAIKNEQITNGVYYKLT